jgi:ceramide glucosyltransferase
MTLITLANSALYLLLLSGIIYHLFALFCVWKFFSARQSNLYPGFFRPVSILKPLKGIDPEFKENLRTFCRQEYPEYEVLLGFLEQDNGAAAKVRDNIVPSMECDVRVVVSSKDLGTNRKVSNLQGLVEAARHPLFALSDSDMRVDSSYLKIIVHEFQSEKKVGMVTNLYKISNPRSLGTALESLTIAVDYMPSVLAARRLEGVTFGLGASMLLSKKALDEIGGLPPIADYLADDYQLGNRLWRKGYTIILSSVVLENIVGRMSIRDYLAHQARWARTYRSSRPKGFAGYGIAHIFPVALLLLILNGPTVLYLSVPGVVLSIRLISALIVYQKVIRSKQWLKWLPLLPVKDLVSFGIWISSFVNNKVAWRGRRYRVVKDGKIQES